MKFSVKPKGPKSQIKNMAKDNDFPGIVTQGRARESQSVAILIQGVIMGPNSRLTEWLMSWIRTTVQFTENTVNHETATTT